LNTCVEHRIRPWSSTVSKARTMAGVISLVGNTPSALVKIGALAVVLDMGTSVSFGGPVTRLRLMYRYPLRRCYSPA
jgi:hypothetical protein